MGAWQGPALLIFIVDPTPLSYTTLLPSPTASGAENAAWLLAAMYLGQTLTFDVDRHTHDLWWTGCQLFFALTFHEARSTGPLPFSCMPVLVQLRSLT